MISLTTKNMREIAKKLEMVVREGKHTNARFEVNGVVVASTCWPHGKKGIPKGTANKILKHQLLLDTQTQASVLRDCDMEREDYIEHIMRKRILEQSTTMD